MTPLIVDNEYQFAIYRAAGYLIIVAGPGCGKTYTLVKLADYNRAKSVLAVAFGKAMAEELERKLMHGMARTTHSMAFEAIKHAYGRGRDGKFLIGFDRDRSWKLADKRLPGRQYNRIKQSLCETVSKCKARMAHTPSAIKEVIDDFLIVTEPLDLANFVGAVEEMLNDCARPEENTMTVDYDDQLWLFGICDWMEAHMKFDEVYVDEVQDFTGVQMASTKKFVSPGGRLVLFGDPNQAIFGFRGAGGMEDFARQLGATEMPLPVCYRCSSSIVEEARRLVPRLEPAPGAREGLVTRATLPTMLRDVKPGDYILSRSNAPLVKLCLMFLRDGVRAQIDGRDMGKTLASMVRRFKPVDVEDLRAKMRHWAEVEVARRTSSEPPQPTEEVYDRLDCLMTFTQNAQTVEQVIDRIEEAFASPNSDDYITLSTVHKAKGQERSRVWLLQNTFDRMSTRLQIAAEELGPGALESSKASDQIRARMTEEKNIQYVAVTRAKDFLCYVDHDFKKDL